MLCLSLHEKGNISRVPAKDGSPATLAPILLRELGPMNLSNAADFEKFLSGAARTLYPAEALALCYSGDPKKVGNSSSANPLAILGQRIPRELAAWQGRLTASLAICQRAAPTSSISRELFDRLTPELNEAIKLSFEARDADGRPRGFRGLHTGLKPISCGLFDEDQGEKILTFCESFSLQATANSSGNGKGVGTTSQDSRKSSADGPGAGEGSDKESKKRRRADQQFRYVSIPNIKGRYKLVYI